jgi:hypothetical protein
VDAQEYTALVDSLEKKLDRLRALYEQYFQGFEKIEPQVQRKEVDRLIYQIRRERVANTAVRFRFQTIIQRHTTLTAYWQRICREIEEGTYFRHILKAEKLKAAIEEGAPAPPTVARGRRRGRHRVDAPADLHLEVDLDGGDEAAGEAVGAAAGQAVGGTAAVAATARARSLDDLRRLLSEADPEAVLAAPSPGSLPPPPSADTRRRPGARPPLRSLAAVSQAPAVVASTPTVPAPSPASAAGRAGPGSGSSGASPAGPPAAGPVPGSARPVAAVRPSVPAASPAKPATSAAVLPPERVASLYAEFAAVARRGDGTPVPSVGALRSSLEKEARRLAQKHPGRRVDFRVEVREGKPVIKSFVVAAKDS